MNPQDQPISPNNPNTKAQKKVVPEVQITDSGTTFFNLYNHPISALIPWYPK